MLRYPKLFLSVSLLTLALAPLSAAYADFYLHGWENQHERQRDLRLLANVGYYQSQNNFDAVGNLLIPAGFQKYSRLQSDLLASYGLTSRLSIFGRVGWARVQLDHSTLPGSTFGLTDSSVGISLHAFEVTAPGKLNGVAVDIQVQGDFPLYSNPDPTLVGNGPAVGDGTTDVTGGAFLTVPVYQGKEALISLVGGGGYTYRTGSFSSAIPWSVSASLSPRDEGFYVEAATLGLQSLRNDPRAATLTVSSTSQSIATGGSFITGAVNPSLITLRGRVGYQFGSDVSIGVYAAQPVWGQAAPNGFNIGVGLQAHIGNHQKSDNARLTAKDYGRSNQGFINYGLEAHVTRTNDRLNLVKIDRGSQDGVAVGQIFDIFMVKKDGSIGEAVARARVSSVLNNEGALTIDEYFKEIWIDEGFVAKRPIQ